MGKLVRSIVYSPDASFDDAIDDGSLGVLQLTKITRDKIEIRIFDFIFLIVEIIYSFVLLANNKHISCNNITYGIIKWIHLRYFYCIMRTKVIKGFHISFYVYSTELFLICSRQIYPPYLYTK